MNHAGETQSSCAGVAARWRGLIFVLLGVAAISVARAAESEGQAAPVIVVDRAAAEIFPVTWRSAVINARAEPLAEGLRQPCCEIVSRAMGKYPAAVLSANLKNVFVLGGLEYFGVRTGGTNSRTAVYLVQTGKYAARDVERNFHAEFSSILLRKFPEYLDRVAWEGLNPPEFRYRGTGSQAVKKQQASLRLADRWHEQGFLNEYGTASIEEDFNSYAGRLFEGHPQLWEAMEKYPKVRSKAALAMAFYRALDGRFTTAFFVEMGRAYTR